MTITSAMINSPELLLLLVLTFLAYLTARIAKKAGYSSWWCLAMLIPLVNLVLVWVFAFSDWPAYKKRNTEHPEGM